jgi:hypothetical protein
MDTRQLIEGIVQQTTVLIAQISTAAGLRAPLARVADQVFLELAREIEAQGVGRKVVADMFGLALRTYQKKVARLSASATFEDRTLWEAVLDFLNHEGSVSRQRVFERFARDSQQDVGAVLTDLVSSGFAYSTGRAETAVFGPTSHSDRRALFARDTGESLLHMVWLTIYRERAIRRDDLLEKLHGRADVEAAIDSLLREGRVVLERRGDAELLCARELMIPVGAEQGWESAVLDHFRAVASAIGSKVRKKRPRAGAGDVTGGSTLSFDLHPGHPHEQQVLGLLHRVRAEVNALYDEVTLYNREHPLPEEQQRRVYFYFGQGVEDETDEGPSFDTEELR